MNRLLSAVAALGILTAPPAQAFLTGQPETDVVQLTVRLIPEEERAAFRAAFLTGQPGGSGRGAFSHQNPGDDGRPANQGGGGAQQNRRGGPLYPGSGSNGTFGPENRGTKDSGYGGSNYNSMLDVPMVLALGPGGGGFAGPGTGGFGPGHSEGGRQVQVTPTRFGRISPRNAPSRAHERRQEQNINYNGSCGSSCQGQFNDPPQKN